MPCPSAFAAQIMGEKLVREAQQVVKPANGLHVARRKRGSQKLEWADIYWSGNWARLFHHSGTHTSHLELFPRIATPKHPKSEQMNMRRLVDIVRLKAVIVCDYQSWWFTSLHTPYCICCLHTQQRNLSWPSRLKRNSADDSSWGKNRDCVLANSILFMRDAMLHISRNSSLIADGDVGRVYEVMKVSWNTSPYFSSLT